MVYTITFNPALDYLINVENFEIGKINRNNDEKILPGGKGLNVSIVLKNLQIDNTALGFIASFTGRQLKTDIEKYGINTDFIEVKQGMTRINVKIMSNNKETAINGFGPNISENDVGSLLKKIESFQKDDIVVLSGNIPKNLKDNIYEIICSILYKKGITYIVDASKDLLINVLKYNPFLIKPNKQEIEETFNVIITNNEQLIKYAKKLQQMGAQNVLISLGGDGAILLNEDSKIYVCKAPKGKVINTVGAGDSMVAGFLAGYLKTKDYEYALKMGVAAGSASAFSMELAKMDDVNMLLNNII